MTLKLVFSAVRGEFAKAIADLQKPLARAATATAKDVGNNFVKPGMRSAISRAGFGPRWQNAARVVVFPKTGIALDPAIWAYHKIKYADIFEEGGTIQPKQRKLLWLPTNNAPKKIGKERLTPATFIKNVGPLHPVRQPGRPLMLAAYMSGRQGSKPTMAKLRRGSALARLGVRARRGRHGQGVTSVVMFIGLPSVRIHARFGLSKVFREAGRKLISSYASAIAKESK